MHLFRYQDVRQNVWLSVWAALVLVAALVLTGPAAKAQSSSGTIDGTAYDTSGALVPGATIVLKNQASGDERKDVSNGEGFFSFVAVPPGAYTVRVTRQGFATWEEKDITLDSAGHIGMSNIKLKVGTKDETVVVDASTTQITPTDSGDKAFTIDQHILQNVAIIGQNAAEFIKIMPGMAMSAGVVNASSYAANQEGTGSGPVGDFSANGQRTAALDITSDGAHIIDPGCNCGQSMNTATEMTSEVTVQTSNFGADSAKGPVVINAVGKSGGQQYHGEVYIYARYYTLNANDWLNNVAGTNPTTGAAIAPRPDTRYYYPGGQFGGPLVLPHSSFNHNHDKLFFFGAFQAYRQVVDNGIFHAAVPTADMRAGDYTEADSNAGYLKNLSGGAIQGLPNGGGINNPGNAYVNGKVDPAQIDPNGKALINVYPLDDANPALNQGWNYIKAATRFANMNQYRGRIDYSISNSTKLFVQYNHQNDNTEESLGTLWVGSESNWDSPTTPYPSPILSTSDSETVTANMTKVFTPTLTNEVLFNWVYLDIPNDFQDFSKVDRTGLGLTYPMLFPHANQGNLIYPEMDGWGNGVANQLNGGFELPGGVFAKKTLPSLADNITKVWKTHTAKFGFYWERTWNQQPGNNDVNGGTAFSSWGANTSGNMYSDMLIGVTTGGYSEANFNVAPAFRYLSTQFYGQDSWKVSRKLTLDYGLRVSHLGPWVDTTGYGFAAWYPSLYASGKGGSVDGATFPGIQWHAENSSTPLSGSASRFAFYSPRVGFAWDLLGTGETILRGGYGIYNYHDEQNVQNGAYGIVRGAFSSPGISAVSGPNVCPTPTTCQWSGRFEDLLPIASFGQSLSIPSGVQALDPTDSRQPQTQDWSFTVAQRAPWKSLVEIAYVGNKSTYLSNYNNAFGEPNNLAIGTLFADGWMPQCYPKGAATDGGACATGTTTYTSQQIDAAEEYPAYGSLKIINHQMYSNYNSLQATWNKQQGHFTYLANYTFSKALGIRGENGAATGDPTNLRNNYGTLPNNRPNIFNVAYIYQFPNFKSGTNAIVRGAANGWQISGITQYQTGVDLQAAVTSNFNYSAYIPAGTTFMGETITTAVQANDSNIIGTPNITLMPKVICNPHSGLAPHQFVNPACFSPFATPGQQGTFIFPTLTGPHYLNSDISVFKNFAFGASESKKLTFRFSGYNFLNHPNRSFQSGDAGLNLTFNSSGVNTPSAPGAPFGYALYKTGHRIIQGEARFSF